MSEVSAQVRARQQKTVAAFRELHRTGCFVIPNPWDPGSARYLQHLGFKALATTSSGFAFSRGLPDSDRAVPRDVALQHFADMAAAVELPVNADFASAYAREPEGVAENVRLCVETGVAGLSVEDATGEAERPLYDLALATERVKAARSAIDHTGTGVLLIARAECYLVRREDALKEAIRRLRSYAEAGADVLFAPGLKEREEIQAIVEAAGPKPVNVLMSSNTALRVGDLAEMGVRRVSVGSALARAAWGGFLRAAKLLAGEGSFAGFEGAVPGTELNDFFEREWKKRS